jgi:hypothetical protein
LTGGTSTLDILAISMTKSGLESLKTVTKTSILYSQDRPVD